MNLKRQALTLCLIALCVVSVFAAGTVVMTEQTVGTVQKVTFAWTSSSGGAADATTASYYSGQVIRAVQIPGSGGTQPSNSYNVSVKDADGVDILSGLGASLSNSATTDKQLKDGLGVVANSQLVLAVTSAGTSKTGTTILYIR